MSVPDTGLLIAVGAQAVRAALVERGRLVELIAEHSVGGSRVGEVHRVRVARIDRQVGGLFLTLAGGETGFMGFESAGAAAGEGEMLLAQVVRDAVQGKQLGLRRRIELAGALAVLSLGGDTDVAVSRRIRAAAERDRLRALVTAAPGEGWLLRTGAATAPPEAIAAEVAALRRTAGGFEPIGAPALLYREPGPVERCLRHFADADPAAIAIDDGAACTAARRFAEAALPRLADRLAHYRGPEPLFQAIEPQIEEALAVRVDLDNGAVMRIERTAALTAIDLDMGGAGARGLSPREVNLAAAPEVARQIRLRGIGGAILVDFLRLKDRADRDGLLGVLTAALARDRLPVRLLGFTRGGLVELTRPHGRSELSRQLAGLEEKG